MYIAKNIEAAIERSSWIRKMFEDGAKLKAEKGADNVFDFSLGNPNLPPPPAFNETLRALIDDEPDGIHGYMPNAGFPETREAVAARVSREQHVTVGADRTVMTVGAGGALNTVFRAIMEPGDEVIVPTPFFVEYVFYAQNHRAELKMVPTTEDFDLKLDVIEAAVTEKTRAVLINSPNNPTGKVYAASDLEGLAKLLKRKSKETGRVIYLLSDEPYRAITYDGLEVPPIFPTFPAAILCSSFSKDLSLAGERIGYIAVNPAFDGGDQLMAALTLTNRILGFVNAPAFMQRAVAKLQDETVDIDYYRANREILFDGLVDAGYECHKPEGAFYLFPKTPIEDDVEFCRELQQENILAVPGSGFMGPGHMRLAYCCSRATVEKSLPGFRRALERVRG